MAQLLHSFLSMLLLPGNCSDNLWYILRIFFLSPFPPLWQDCGSDSRDWYFSKSKCWSWAQKDWTPEMCEIPLSTAVHQKGSSEGSTQSCVQEAGVRGLRTCGSKRTSLLPTSRGHTVLTRVLAYGTALSVTVTAGAQARTESQHHFQIPVKTCDYKITKCQYKD